MTRATLYRSARARAQGFRPFARHAASALGTCSPSTRRDRVKSERSKHLHAVRAISMAHVVRKLRAQKALVVQRRGGRRPHANPEAPAKVGVLLGPHAPELPRSRASASVPAARGAGRLRSEPMVAVADDQRRTLDARRRAPRRPMTRARGTETRMSLMRRAQGCEGACGRRHRSHGRRLCAARPAGNRSRRGPPRAARRTANSTRDSVPR